MIWSYVLAFCRVAIGLLFLFSGMGKLRDLSQFQQTITNFRLLPAQMSYPTSLLFVSAEVAVVPLVALGGRFLLPGFLLALLLLLIFVGALISVLLRKIQTPCNCFGSNEKSVTQADIWRDTVFLLCALGGSVLTLGRMGREQLELLTWLLIAGMAIIFVLTASFLDDIVQLIDVRNGLHDIFRTHVLCLSIALVTRLGANSHLSTGDHREHPEYGSCIRSR